MLCLLACLAALAGRAGEAGHPFVSVYQPRDYGAQSQNWAVVQDLRGLVYVGNGEGVLEFDGARWRLIPTPNRTPVRSLAVDAQGRVYVGAVGEVGCLAPDARGQMAYVSLNPRLESAHTRFSEVWRIHPTSAGVYFFTRECIFLITPDGLHSWQTERPLHNAYGVGERFFVQEMDVGLLELDGQRLKPVACGERFQRDKIFCILPWEGRLLIGTRAGLFLHDGTRLTPFPTEADAYLKANLLYQGALLQDGTLALATLEGGTVLLAHDGTLQLILDPRTGLPDKTVYCLCPDRQGGLWMGLSHGLARVQWPAPFTRFGTASGLEGTVLAIHREGRTLYAGTSLGLFRLEAPGRGGPGVFRQVPGLKSQTWALCPSDQGFLVGNYQGLFEVRAGVARPVPGLDATVLAIHRGRRDGCLHLGLDGGLARLHRAGPGSPWVNEGRLPGIQEAVHSIEEDEDGRLWLGTMGGEVLRVGFPAAGAHAQPMVERFGEARGLPAQRQADVARVSGRVVFATNAGVYQFDEASRQFRPDPRFARGFQAGPRRVLLLKEEPGGRVWMETQDEDSHLRELALGTPAPDGAFTWERAPFIRFGAMELDAIAPEPDGKVWLGGVEGLFRYDPAVSTATAQDFAAHVRSAAPLEATGGLRLDFAATSFDSDWTTLYQIRLDGRDRDWSPWSPTAFKEYSYLAPGPYAFRVRALNGSGALSREDRWAFVIQPRWYASRWARGLFALLGCGALLAAWAAVARALKAQARTLEGVREELRASTEEKNQFISMVGHDLRNPLNGIMLAAELLEDAATDPGITRTAGQIRNECRNMDGLIGRFLDMAAIEAGTLRPSPSVCALGELARQTADRHEARAVKKGIRLELDLEPLAGPAFTDAKFAREILESLLSNAVKFSPRDTRVTLRLRREGDRLLLTVQDQGPGFTAEDLARLYRPFTKLSARPTGQEKAVGLGLAIVKHMVDAQGGTLTLNTAPGQGAAFQVSFPAAP